MNKNKEGLMNNNRSRLENDVGHLMVSHTVVESM